MSKTDKKNESLFHLDLVKLGRTIQSGDYSTGEIRPRKTKTSGVDCDNSPPEREAVGTTIDVLTGLR